MTILPDSFSASRTLFLGAFFGLTLAWPLAGDATPFFRFPRSLLRLCSSAEPPANAWSIADAQQSIRDVESKNSRLPSRLTDKREGRRLCYWKELLAPQPISCALIRLQLSFLPGSNLKMHFKAISRLQDFLLLMLHVCN